MALVDLHNPWAFTAGILGNFVSILVFFAPLPTFIQIYKRKSTLEFQAFPYMVALFSAMLWMYYAFLKKNTTLLITVNSVGILIETIYLVIFIFYASKEVRKYTVRLLVLLNMVMFTGICLGTLFLFKGQIRVQVVGWICVTISVGVFAAPLSIAYQVVKTQSVEFMPFTLSFLLTLSAIIWFAYGLLQRDLHVAFPNILGFLLGVIQMLLYGIYKNKNNGKNVVEVMEKKVAEHTITINIDKKGGGGGGGALSEVYPVESQSSSNGGSDEDENKDEGITGQHDINQRA